MNPHLQHQPTEPLSITAQHVKPPMRSWWTVAEDAFTREASEAHQRMRNQTSDQKRLPDWHGGRR